MSHPPHCSSIKVGGPPKWTALPPNTHTATLCTNVATAQAACSFAQLRQSTNNVCLCRSGKQGGGRTMPVPGPASKLGLVGHAGGGHEATHAAGPLCISAAPAALPG